MSLQGAKRLLRTLTVPMLMSAVGLHSEGDNANEGVTWKARDLWSASCQAAKLPGKFHNIVL